jgi:hypothetical protein
MKKHLDTWNHFLNESKLRVFDFDDTLAVTDADVLATRADGTEFKLSPSEYAVYEPIAEYNPATGEYINADGEVFDFSEFDKLINPRQIEQVARIMQKVVDAEKRDGAGRKIAILTARAPAAGTDIMDFLENVLKIDSSMFDLVTLGSSDPQQKKAWIEDQIINLGMLDILFFDDSPKNIAAVDELKQEYPNATIVTRLVGYAEDMEEAKEPVQDHGEFQTRMRKQHTGHKKDLIGKGDNKETGGGKGHTNPNMERSKSSPPGGV